MNLYNNMEFEIKSSFIPNLSKSDKLKILDVTPKSVVIQLHNSKCRGVFPFDHFQYWIKKGSLIPINEHVEKTS
ncbi:hypothetical protein [Peribacillus tepidiphilus]|jgi:hypothetical protein|uniref:hypothetical protein n=1 Tax=Peribacillus tepidiphilus TaxID=2652445 RepID=UPI0012928106|nr:hypothetical protein [Peribacillus tepidiphilus]